MTGPEAGSDLCACYTPDVYSKLQLKIFCWDSVSWYNETGRLERKRCDRIRFSFGRQMSYDLVNKNSTCNVRRREEIKQEEEINKKEADVIQLAIDKNKSSLLKYIDKNEENN